MKVSFDSHTEHAAFGSDDATAASEELRKAMGLDGFEVECSDPDCPDAQKEDDDEAEDDGERMVHYRKVNGQYEVRS